jgi:hypothetical protein
MPLWGRAPDGVFAVIGEGFAPQAQSQQMIEASGIPGGGPGWARILQHQRAS